MKNGLERKSWSSNSSSTFLKKKIHHLHNRMNSETKNE